MSCCVWCAVSMEGEEMELPVSQKVLACQDCVKEADETVLSDGEYDYLSQVCEPAQFSPSLTDDHKVDSGFISQSGVIPLVPYEDEDNQDEPKTDEETSNFFFGLLNDSWSDDPAPHSQAVPAMQSDSDTQWLRSQGIDFNPAEW